MMFFKSKKSNTETETESKSPGFFERMRSGLSRTAKPLSDGLGQLFLGKKEIDDELLEDLEALLLSADIGVDASDYILASLTEKLKRRELNDETVLRAELKNLLLSMLLPVEAPLEPDADKAPYVILVVGVNGVGKTTTIGKLAQKYKGEGRKVMLAAGDTFRAAAVEQLQVWGERNSVPVVSQHSGADSASVIYDGLQAAKARHMDILIADTAGRLHNKSNLMDELSKVTRVLSRLDPEAPHEVLLVLDAGTGQNAMSQLEQFAKAVKVSGMVLTKLDGTAKGGVIFALARKYQVPVRFIGVGEGLDDLQVFRAREFVDALLEPARGA